MYRYARPAGGPVPRAPAVRRRGVRHRGARGRRRGDGPRRPRTCATLGHRRATRSQVNSIGDETCRPAYREELLAYLERASRRADRRAPRPVRRRTRCACSTARTTACRARRRRRAADHRPPLRGVRGALRRPSATGSAAAGSPPTSRRPLVRGPRLLHAHRVRVRRDGVVRAAGDPVRRRTLRRARRGARRAARARASGSGWVSSASLLALADEGVEPPERAAARRLRRRRSATVARAAVRALVDGAPRRGGRGGHGVRGPPAEGPAQAGRPRRRGVRGDRRRARARRRAR